MSINVNESTAGTINLTEIDTDDINMAELLAMLFYVPPTRMESDPEPTFELPYDLAVSVAYTAISGGIAYVGSVLSRGGVVHIAGLVGALWFGANAAIDAFNAGAKHGRKKRAWRERQAARVSK